MYNFADVINFAKKRNANLLTYYLFQAQFLMIAHIFFLNQQVSSCFVIALLAC